MINFIFIITTIPALVFLYFQWKINQQQERFIKSESESLRRLQEVNEKFIAADLFGLSPNCAYLKAPAPQPRLMAHRKQLLTGNIQRNRKKDYQIY